ncbi:hypothetical protein [Tengunoibacter tsumagoiensis]|uniref:N-acetyltransferase domain-containing protein n=1 Tax=Tengunoibacter tsumagoiensis TaxID=2014871 RepID=A0A402AAD8_9CHLR|nr:hypothetical protein [Tengunoibacter tsumagoiensis]GCE16127.1 hypothetical protein KTT_59860 [Tengunoibacter tsumagoiensis]
MEIHVSDPHPWVLKEQVGLVWSWWKHDPLPVLPSIATLQVETTDDLDFIVDLVRILRSDAIARLEAGHRLYIATIEQKPVAYGWAASTKAAFGSPSVHFQVPATDRYLYHFVTFLPWRGQGIYPRLLQAIILRELEHHERFWIIHQITNISSQRGIARAGFHIANRVYRRSDSGLALKAAKDAQRASEGANLLGLPLVLDNHPL